MEQSPEHIRACYDAVAREYADRFSNELRHKPLDSQLLERFAAEVDGPLYDLGCGPGHTTALLHSCGADVRGIDLSPNLVREARALNPAIEFAVGDMLSLPLADGTAAGLVAFYAIVHFSPDQLRRAIAEAARVLRPGGRFLLAFHVGNEAVHVDEFLGRPMSLDFIFFDPATVVDELRTARFGTIEVVEREPYPGAEHPSRRAYVTATRATTT